ncbi:DMT family transporter [Corynebacterium halotolerans]|uniref:Uncharacterized protein n=1 Tax=Corynebacterium halotolerans YIM 70093 = DSM 44683 TaxID=1121362 RepID=M1P1X0_9CORY|nr:DMT family transporter [Corynebacterium halotolerans]AGF73815.1 hypothetical protein A605_14217 [Corynebacterium halotolerans YIM 70093 = DSM 44683]
MSTKQGTAPVRAVGCAVIVWGIWTLFSRDALPSGRRQWRHTILTALLMQVAYQAAFFVALDQEINPGMLALIVSAQPLITAVLTGTRPRVTWLILAVGLTGVGLAVAADIDLTNPGAVGGYLAAVIALLAITVGTLTQKSNSEVGVWANLAIQSTIAVAVFVVALPIVGLGTWEPGWRFVGAATWMVLVVSVGATALLYSMVGKRDAVSVTSLFFLVPAVTAVLDFIVNGTTLPLLTILGFGLTIGALIMIQRQPTFSLRKVEHA